jgi:hypothetical protein
MLRQNRGRAATPSMRLFPPNLILNSPTATLPIQRRLTYSLCTCTHSHSTPLHPEYSPAQPACVPTYIPTFYSISSSPATRLRCAARHHKNHLPSTLPKVCSTAYSARQHDLSGRRRADRVHMRIHMYMHVDHKPKHCCPTPRYARWRCTIWRLQIGAAFYAQEGFLIGWEGGSVLLLEELGSVYEMCNKLI